ARVERARARRSRRLARHGPRLLRRARPARVAAVSSRELYLGLILIIGVERLVELVVSSRNARRTLARGGFETGRAHDRVMVALRAAFLVASPVEVFLGERAFPGALGFAALGGAALAQALRWWAIVTLGERWSTRIVVLPGAPLVTSGPYRFARHPN